MLGSTAFHCVAIARLELSMLGRLVLKLTRSSCLCIPSTEIKVIHYDSSAGFQKSFTILCNFFNSADLQRKSENIRARMFTSLSSIQRDRKRKKNTYFSSLNSEKWIGFALKF